MACGFLAGAFVARLLPQPETAYQILTWWITVIATATVTATGTDRLGRKLLPLTVLLKMTMLFPDEAPSRLKMARRAGNVNELRKRIAAAEHGGDADLAEMAELILSLSTAISNHDRKTRGHSERTRAYTELLAEELNLAEGDRDRLRWAALLHDVGKLEVPAEILNKDSALTEDEWHQIRQHPVHGMHLIAPLVPWLGHWAETIAHHHERWDGSGYPFGLSGTDIALGARIVSVADAYDVMTSGRSYQRSKTPAAARQEVAKMAGTQFDPAIARALMNVSLGKLRWSTGPLAVLAEIPFLRGLPQVGRDAATILMSSAVMATSLVIGAVPAPLDLRNPEIVEVVIANVGIEQDIPDLALPEVRGDGNQRATSPETSTTTSTTAPAAVPSTTQPEPATTTTLAPPPSTTTTTAPPPSPSAPRANDDVATVAEDGAVQIPVLANDSDPDGDLDASTLSILQPPLRGTVTIGVGTIAYQPNPNEVGNDFFTYRICDSGGRCDDGTVSLSVVAMNDQPVAPPVQLLTSRGIAARGPLDYSDVDDDPLTCSIGAPPPLGSAFVTTDCSQVTYLPPADFVGTLEFTVSVSDGTDASAGRVTVKVIQTNRAPEAVADSASTVTGTSVTIAVLANDTDPDGDTLSIGTVSNPSAGTTSIVGDAVVFTPPAAGVGVVTFTYTACDTSGACSSPVTVTVTINAPPEP